MHSSRDKACLVSTNLMKKIIFLNCRQFVDRKSKRMSGKYRNKFRISSARLQAWDYSWNGAYFITICTKNRISCFGDIVDGKMKLSNHGVLADVFWSEIKNHAKNITLGEFVVMPNHVHGILILNNDDHGGFGCDGGRDKACRRDKACLVSTTNTEKSIGQQRFQNQGKNTISSIVGAYKSAVTKHAHRLGYEFAWQSRFHDHIIRNEKSFNQITEYVINNPGNWEKDKFHPDRDNLSQGMLRDGRDKACLVSTTPTQPDKTNDDVSAGTNYPQVETVDEK